MGERQSRVSSGDQCYGGSLKEVRLGEIGSNPEAMVNRISELLDKEAQMKGLVATYADKIYASIARLPSIPYQNFTMRTEDSIRNANAASPLSMEVFKENLRGLHKKYVKLAVKKRRDNEATAMANTLQGTRDHGESSTTSATFAGWSDKRRSIATSIQQQMEATDKATTGTTEGTHTKVLYITATNTIIFWETARNRDEKKQCHLLR